MKIAIIVLVILVLFFVVVIAVDSNRFVVRKYEIVSDKVSESRRIVFISDLHNKQYGKNNEKLLAEIREINPDVILVGGDIMTAYPGRNFTPATNFISELKKDYNVVYALGNHEFRAKIYPDVYGDLYFSYEKAMEDIGISFLDNDKVSVATDIDVYGLSIEAQYYRRFRLYPMSDDYVEEMLGGKDEDKFTILLAHNPEYFEKYVCWEPDLILSGHLHGGVIRVPGWRGVISPMWHLFPKYAGGLYTSGDSRMIVSRGLGMHTIPFRMFNPAEIVVIDIKNE